MQKDKKEERRYKPSHIANYFFDKSRRDDYPLTPMKLIKLVYIAYGWALAFQNKLFDESVEVWQYGPVIPSLYHEFKTYGSRFIEHHSVEFDLDSDDEPINLLDSDDKLSNLKTKIPRVPEGDEETMSVLDFVWRSYKGFTAFQLSDLTHKTGTPWDKAHKEGKTSIDNESIAEHFKNKYGEYFGE